MTEANNRRRVVITGLGAISPLGSSVQQTWEGWINGVSGIRRISQFDASNMPCQIAGEIPDFNPEDYLERKEARRVPRSSQIALAAAMQAAADAGLEAPFPDGERSGVVFGTAIDYSEDSTAETDLNVVMNDGGPFIDLQGTAEGHAFRRDELNAMLDLAEKGARELMRLQLEALRG